MSAQKMEQDFTPLVEEKIPENRKLALEKKNLAQAIENLLVIEKQTRNGGDAPSTGKILSTIVELCYETKDFKALNENIVLLSKRRGQLKQAIKVMVKKAMSFLESLDYDHKMELIDTLSKVTEGKIFVEKQRARLILNLAHIREKEGKISEAANILQEIQVETFGAMKRKEKTNYILEQMRLCLAKRDYIRAQIMSRKIAQKVLDDKEFQEEKIKYYTLMVEYYTNEGKNLDIARSYFSMYNTPLVKENPEKWKYYLKNVILFLIASPYDNEQSDFINRVNEDVKLNEIPAFKDLTKKFLTTEIIRWADFTTRYKPELDQLDSLKGANKDKLWETIQKRVTEHSIRVVSKYYQQIKLARLSELLSLDNLKTEAPLAELVVNKSIYARVNRPEGLINFVKPKDPNQILNEWSSDISSLLGLVERTCHLIYRENMIHKIDTKGVTADGEGDA
jgi:26S proteasome regulatory subunit N5